jgi:AmmeMemoRadiSam system protein B
MALDCPFGLFPQSILISREWFNLVVRHFDGSNSLLSIQARILKETSRLIALDNLQSMVAQLDRSLALDSPAFARFLAEYKSQRTRPPAHAGGSYLSSERALRLQLGRYFAHPDGSGEPTAPTHNGNGNGNGNAEVARLRGILTPHIDFGRGGPVYTWAYRELVERSDADVFVIFGVAHSPCERRFALTRKDFQTPLGLARTDQDFVDAIAGRVGVDLFEDELAHRREHSIEFQVVFLQYLLSERRDFSIVPILVGSFHDLMERGVDPIDDPEVAGLVAAVQHAEGSLGKKVAYIGGIDLCHVGPEFGDRRAVDQELQDEVRRFDLAMLDRAGAVDPAGWFGKAAEVNDRWRVCGLSATYAMLHAMGPARGKLLKYDQAIDERRNGCVTFASLAYETPVAVPDPSTEV